MSSVYKKDIIAIIPARSGSKSIKNKNIINLFGKPLIYYSINVALKCKHISRVIVSTDSKKIKKIALKYGADVPFLRPKKYSLDNSRDYEVISHALKWLKNNESYEPDLIIHLRPSYPMRDYKFIDKQISIAVKNKNFDAYKSVVEASQTPFKMWFKSKKFIRPVIGDLKKEYFNYPRQLLRKVYWQNACLDIINPKSLKGYRSISGKKIIPIIMKDNEVYDVDHHSDLKEIKKKFTM